MAIVDNSDSSEPSSSDLSKDETERSLALKSYDELSRLTSQQQQPSQPSRKYNYNQSLSVDNSTQAKNYKNSIP